MMKDQLVSAAAGRPQAILDATERDFGTVAAGQVLEHTFPVRNSGNRRLVITERCANCDGRPGREANLIVEPGQTAQLRVQFDTNQCRGRAQRVVDYHSSDPELPRFTLKLLATIEGS